MRLDELDVALEELDKARTLEAAWKAISAARSVLHNIAIQIAAIEQRLTVNK